ncbi:hypothetical protein HU200_063478 [Digitaria exilis]|uniref:Uncharacterized protein n=1 Tax=Digitaria exilis TaxID=1010633 RepID=A0A835DW90_9POAL|nr:hypothetical protein HU200_063478 [Digitaria exilis]
MDFTAPSFSLGFDSDDDDPAPPAGSGPREQPGGYAAPDAPSFSLGFDFDADTDEEPRAPAGGRREEQARVSAAPDPPSFSLEFDDDTDEEPRAPAGGRREEQARVSAAPDPPSFSLEFDDDDGGALAGLQRHEQAQPQVAPGAPPSAGAEDEEDDFVLAGGGEPPPQETHRFKRLRKGPAPPNPPQARRCEAPDAPSFSLDISDDDDDEFLAGDQHHPRPPPGAHTPSALSFEDGALGTIGTGSLEDEIEDWTTDEDRPVRDVPASVGSCSTSRNPKFSLLNRGVLMTQSTTKTKAPKVTETSNSSASKSLEESCTKKLLPKITISPMRKIHLLDSDSDADDDQNKNKAKKPVSPIKRRQESMHKYMQEKPILQQNSKPQGSTTVQSEDMMNDNWATPALDEFCNEYYKSTKDAGSSQQKESNSFSCSKGFQSKYSIGDMEGHFQQQNTSGGAVLDGSLDARPPAMHYFFHHDPRVHDLVRDRLQYFFPIGVGGLCVKEWAGVVWPRCLSTISKGDKTFIFTVILLVNIRTTVTRTDVTFMQKVMVVWHQENMFPFYCMLVTPSQCALQESGRGYGRYKKKGSSGTKRGAAKVKVEKVAKHGTSRAKRKR